MNSHGIELTIEHILPNQRENTQESKQLKDNHWILLIKFDCLLMEHAFQAIERNKTKNQIDIYK